MFRNTFPRRPLAWTVFTLCRNLSVVFVPWRWDCWSVYPRFYLTKKLVNFWFNGKILSLLIIFSQLIFCQVLNCKMLVSTNILLISQSSLKAYARILYTRIQNKENSFSLCGKLSSHWKLQWPAKKRKNNRLAHTHIRVLGWRELRVFFGSDISELHCSSTAAS